MHVAALSILLSMGNRNLWEKKHEDVTNNKDILYSIAQASDAGDDSLPVNICSEHRLFAMISLTFSEHTKKLSFINVGYLTAYQNIQGLHYNSRKT